MILARELLLVYIGKLIKAIYDEIYDKNKFTELFCMDTWAIYGAIRDYCECNSISHWFSSTVPVFAIATHW